MYQIILSITESIILNLDKLLLTAVSFLRGEENVSLQIVIAFIVVDVSHI